MQLSDIHKTNPYEGFDPSAYPLDLTGWGHDAPAFEQILRRRTYRLIVEVGSWKGASAVRMANLCPKARIICVDTWLGSLEFWLDQADEERYTSLQLRHGYPTVYYQFLANIIHSEIQDRVIPFPITSQLAARFMGIRGVRPDVVYIDGSHAYDDVLADMEAYWPLIRTDGILFGDDLDTWIDVNHAVQAFESRHDLRARRYGRHWMLRKRS